MTASITVVGLGSGDERQLTLGIWQKIQHAQHVYLRTEAHPVVEYLRQQGVKFTAFDDIYEEKNSFSEVYQAIVVRLLDVADQQQEEIIYAVPGHPYVAEATTRMLQEQCKQRGIGFTVMGGESFLDQAFLRLGCDPIEGFSLLDATSMEASQLQPRGHIFIAQIYDAFTASDAKLALMEVYPAEHPIIFAQALGVSGAESIREIPLFELDRQEDYGNLVLVYIRPSSQDTLRNRTLERTHEIVAALRAPDGCPWDREQTHESIRANLIEETYEVLETIDDADSDAMCEELGDLLLQVMMHAQMEEELGCFNIYDVVQGINEKLVRRHPHVFGTASAAHAEEALANWQAIKAEEKRLKGVTEKQSQLAGIPRDLPAVSRAYELQRKAAKVGFDWPDIAGVFDKIEEELQELKEAQFEPIDRQREELGDLLFSVVNVARFLKLDPEEALARCNRKFMSRFAYVEEKIGLSGQEMAHTSLEEMEELWQEAKRTEGH